MRRNWGNSACTGGVTESLEPTEPLAPSVESAPERDEESSAPGTFGWAPILAATAAVGLLLVSIADAQSRSMTSASQTLFWVGLVVVYAPIAARLAASEPRRLERLSLVALLGLALYVVKVFRDPFGFTFADELVHAPNAEAILRTHHLFHANSILSATASYPGLESVTAALASLSGLSVYGAGLIVIGVARLLIVLAIFLLVERLLDSPRAGGIAVAVYAANSNFVFFSAQFSYESLALPLLVVALFAYVEWRRTSHGLLWASAIILLTVAIVATHHLTSYALAGTFAVTAIGYAFFGSSRESPARFAAFGIAAVAAWLLVVASATVGYLSPVVVGAVRSVVNTISGESAPRQLFAPGGGGGGSSGGSGPVGRSVALGAVGILGVLYLVGVRQVWRRHRGDPYAVVLTIAGGVVFATYGLRFAPQAWETANRSSEFLFLGLALVVPLALVHLGGRFAARRGFAAATAAVLTIAFAGGVVAGWTPSLRLSQPYEISAAGHVIPAEGRAMASWALRRLGPGRRYAASDADARLLDMYAAGFAVAGRNPDVADILKSPRLDPWELPVLRHNHLRFVVSDRRARSFNNTAGYFFGFRSGSRRDEQEPPQAVSKFNRFDRVFDSGNIVIFDLGRR